MRAPKEESNKSIGSNQAAEYESADLILLATSAEEDPLMYKEALKQHNAEE